MKVFGRKVNLAVADINLTNNVVGMFMLPKDFVITDMIGPAVPALGTALVLSIGDRALPTRYLSASTIGAAGGALPAMAATGLFFRTVRRHRDPVADRDAVERAGRGHSRSVLQGLRALRHRAGLRPRAFFMQETKDSNMTQKVTVTYKAPPGDSKVIEAYGHTFFDGKPEDIEVEDHVLGQDQRAPVLSHWLSRRRRQGRGRRQAHRHAKRREARRENRPPQERPLRR
jgi:hypothetical protein